MAGYPNAKFRYRVEIEGVAAGGFTEVTGSDITIDPIEYREGDMTSETPMKVPGLKKYGNLTFKQGIADNKAMYDWIAQLLTPGMIVRKTITITLLNEAQQPAASWQAINAWPTKYTAPDFNSTADEIAIETMEVVHEGLTRVS